MNKEELVSAITEKSGLSKTDVSKFLGHYIEAVTEALVKGGTVQLIGFANLSVVARAARDGRNPQTGKPIRIEASKVVKFTAGKKLKEAVNG